MKKWKPGQEATKDMNLSVVNSKGKEVGNIKVDKGDTIPPTRIDNAVGYVEK